MFHHFQLENIQTAVIAKKTMLCSLLKNHHPEIIKMIIKNNQPFQ